MLHAIAFRTSILCALALVVNIALAADIGDYEISVDGLACPFCAYGIEKHLRRIDGVEKVETNVAAGTVVLWTVDEVELGRAEVEQAVRDAGFEMKHFRELGDGA